MRQAGAWVEAPASISAAALVAAATTYGAMVYDPQWRSVPSPLGVPHLAWSDAAHVLVIQAAVLVALTTLVLACTAVLMRSALVVFAGQTSVNVARWWAIAMTFVIAQAIAVLSQFVFYARDLARYPLVAGQGGAAPYFFWQIMLVRSVAPLLLFCACLSIVHKRGNFEWAISALGASAISLWLTLSTTRPSGFSVASISGTLAAAFICLLLQFLGYHRASSVQPASAVVGPDA